MGEKIVIGILFVLAIGFLVFVLVTVDQSSGYEELCQQNGYAKAESLLGKTYCIDTNTDGTMVSIPVEDLREQFER